jgi:hypothetical protein
LQQARDAIGVADGDGDGFGCGGHASEIVGAAGIVPTGTCLRLEQKIEKQPHAK